MAGKFGNCRLTVLGIGLDHFYKCDMLLWNQLLVFKGMELIDIVTVHMENDMTLKPEMGKVNTLGMSYWKGDVSCICQGSMIFHYSNKAELKKWF